MLAALCAQHATWLDETTRARVRTAVGALFPPRNDGDVRLLARLGPAALDHLPDPAHVPTKEQARPFIDLINEIGGAEAMPHARRWALAHPELSYPFVRSWGRYPVETYARQVLSAFDLALDFLRVDSQEKLAALHHLPSATDLVINGCFTSVELHASLRERPWTDLTFQRNPCMTDLSFLEDCAEELRNLSLKDCPAVRDLGPLAGLPALRMVYLDMSRVPDTALAATASKELRFLRLSHVTAVRLSQLPAHPRLRSLTVDGTFSLEVDSLDGWTHLQELELDIYSPVRPLLAALRQAPQVAHVTLTLASLLTEFGDEEPVPSVEDLVIRLDTDMHGLEQIPRVFPALKWLMLTPPTYVRYVDLSPLQAMPECRVTVTGDAEITGGEGLDVDR